MRGQVLSHLLIEIQLKLMNNESFFNRAHVYSKYPKFIWLVDGFQMIIKSYEFCQPSSIYNSNTTVPQQKNLFIFNFHYHDICMYLPLLNRHPSPVFTEETIRDKRTFCFVTRNPLQYFSVVCNITSIIHYIKMQVHVDYTVLTWLWVIADHLTGLMVSLASCSPRLYHMRIINNPFRHLTCI